MNFQSKPLIHKIVLLGNSGFIGSHLARSFLDQQSGVELIGLSLPEIDLADGSSRSLLVDIFDETTAVIICAAVKRQFGDTLKSFHQNMQIVENIIAAIQSRPVARVLFMSSAAVYGEEIENVGIDEKTPVNPSSYYGIAKFTGECLLRKALPPQTKLLCLRPPLIYGPGDSGLIYGPSGFCSAARAGSVITLWGDGTELREFLYIDDFCNILCGLTYGDFSGILNLVSGVSYRFVDIIECLKQWFPDSLKIDQRERSKQKVDNAFKPNLLHSLLPDGFAFTPLADGVMSTLRHLP